MANILNSVMGTRNATVEEDDGQGGTRTVERAVPVVKEVTFMLDRSTPHTLKFLDQGTVIKDGEGVERVVGDGLTPYHEFATPEEAIQAYLDGKV